MAVFSPSDFGIPDRDPGSKLVTGNEGIAVDQDPTTGSLLSKMVGDQDTAIAQDSATGRLLSEMVGSQGNAILQDASDRLIAAMVGSQGNTIAQDANNRLESTVVGGNNNPVAQNASDELVTRIRGDQGTDISQTATGSQRNDTYEEGASFNISSYPDTTSPTETVYEIVVFSAPFGQTLDITTSSGTTISGVQPKATSFVIDSVEMASFTFNDDGFSKETTGIWAGE